MGRLIEIDDTRLHVVERGEGEPLIVLHGGPGLDHHEFADYLHPLGEVCRLILVDQRSQGRSDPTPPSTWTLERFAQDVIMLARAMGLPRYAVLGHSFGAFVALQNAVDFPGMASRTIVSCGVPSERFLAAVERNLLDFEPIELRERVAASWEAEATVRTAEDVASVLHDQWPFHFADPLDPRIAEYERRAAEAVYAPEVLRRFAAEDAPGIEVLDRLGEIPQPVLVLAGRHDRTCPVEAAGVMATRIPDAELVVFEASAHMPFVEEPDAYVEAVRGFLSRF